MKHVVHALLATSLILAAVPSAAQQPFVYPANGQSDSQMAKDKYECHQWAVNSTGFDPNQVSGAQPQNPGVVGGAARGAALGAIGGAIAGDAGTGAAAGAAVGATARLMGNRRQRVQYDQAVNQANQTFARAYAACLEGRGYTVK